MLNFIIRYLGLFHFIYTMFSFLGDIKVLLSQLKGWVPAIRPYLWT